jgi:hypothetical protein
MLDWLIVGGGIHGTYLSFFLTRVKRLPINRVGVLDPYERPLARWDEMTRNTGMTFLRSPHVQSLDHDPWSISTFAKTRAGESLAQYIPLYNRPSLALFRAHSEWLIQRHKLDAMRLCGRAQGLERIGDGWRVDTSKGTIEARRVLLAVGATEQPYWPAWATALREAGAQVNHIYDPGFNRETLPEWSQAVIVGGGITAAQTALAMGRQAPGTVTVLMRHDIRVQPFDTDLCWIRSSCLADFHRLSDYGQRRQMIKQARYRGSLPPDVFDALKQADEQQVVRVRKGEVESAQYDEGKMTLTLAGGAGIIACDRLILATGFDTARPGGEWLNRAIDTYELPLAECGYPIVDQSLRWQDGLFVSGPLAELEVGPVSRNIIGARLAADRIATALAS